MGHLAVAVELAKIHGNDECIGDFAPIEYQGRRLEGAEQSGRQQAGMVVRALLSETPKRGKRGDLEYPMLAFVPSGDLGNPPNLSDHFFFFDGLEKSATILAFRSAVSVGPLAT